MAKKKASTPGYIARNKQAKKRGFSGYPEERRYKTAHKSEIEHAGQSRKWREMHGDKDFRTYDPQQLVAFDRGVAVNKSSFNRLSRPDQGRIRHNAVSYFMEYETMDQDEAIQQMRMLYGES